VEHEHPRRGPAAGKVADEIATLAAVVLDFHVVRRSAWGEAPTGLRGGGAYGKKGKRGGKRER
jgi:hypothetical protein